MALTAHELIDQVLHRVRDPQGTTVSREFVLTLLSKAQQIVNANLGFVYDTTILTTEPFRCFYPIAQVLPASQKVLYVEVGNKDLLHVPWRNFWAMKRGWPREVAEAMQIWSTIGRDILVLWPTLRVSASVTIKSSKLMTPLVNEEETPEMPDDLLGPVVDIAEVLALLKMRKFDLATESIQSAVGRIAGRVEG